jgi:hypothetical protein
MASRGRTGPQGMPYASRMASHSSPGSGLEDPGQQFHGGFGLGLPLAVVVEAGVVGEMRQVEDLAEAAPLVLGYDHRNEILAVGAPVAGVNWRPDGQALRQGFEPNQIAGPRGQGGSQEGDLRLLAAALQRAPEITLALVERKRSGRGHIRDHDRKGQGSSVRPAAGTQDAGPGLDHQVVGRLVPVRTPGAEGRHLAVNKMRIEVAKGFVIDPEAAGHIIPEVADDHVGRPAELVDDGLAFRRSEIHNDVPLIPVQGQARL